jgi:hypothetical protein
VTEYTAPLGFFKPEQVSEDTERTGLKRAARVEDPDDPKALDFHKCTLRDWSEEASAPLNLAKMGFDVIDLSPHEGLQGTLEKVRVAGELDSDDARNIRHSLRGRVFKLSSGKCLRLIFIAPEGFIMRKGGPNGLKPDPEAELGEMNGHDAATAVHGDQDVRGTPLKQMMRGMAPWMFRHQTPDGDNRWSPLMLVNLWIPLEQITRPLTLMDRRTLNKRAHQLRYALPTESFLEREEDTRVNDIWTFLHDDDQQWYFSSDMNAKNAYVFDTLGTPHGATILPGEELAEQCYVALRDAGRRVRAGTYQADQEAASTDAANAMPPEDCTPALAAGIQKMQTLLAQRNVIEGGAEKADIEAWLGSVDRALDRVVRKSLEMRVVALRLPDVWPFNRESQKV